jgi:hypothetical protein
MKQFSIEIKWAVIFFIAGLLWMLLERLVGLHDEHIDKHATYTNLFAIVAIALYVFALLEKRKKYYGGKMTYKQGVITGLIMTAIITLLTPLSQYLTSTVITPEYFSNVIRYAVDSGALTQQAAEEYFNMKSYMLQSLIFAPVVGVVTTLIVALFTRKK